MPSISSRPCARLERVVVGRDEPRAGQQHRAGRNRVVAHDPGCELAGERFIRAVEVSPQKSSRPSSARIRIRIGNAASQSSGTARTGPMRTRRRRSWPGGYRAGSRLRCRARDVVADRDRDRLSVFSEHEAELGLRHHPARVAAQPDRAVRADRAPHVGVLHEELGAVGLVDEGVDVARVGLRLLQPRVAAALVRDAGAPDLRCMNRCEQVLRGERLGVPSPRSAASGSSWSSTSPRLAVPARDARPALGLHASEADQYVARPPEMSKHAPVEKLISCLRASRSGRRLRAARRRALAGCAPSCSRCAPVRSGRGSVC